MPEGSYDMSEKYTVTDVDERRRFSTGGKQITFYDIQIRTARGSTGSVQIDQADYEKEKVRSILDALYERLEMPFAL